MSFYSGILCVRYVHHRQVERLKTVIFNVLFMAATFKSRYIGSSDTVLF